MDDKTISRARTHREKLPRFHDDRSPTSASSGHHLSPLFCRVRKMWWHPLTRMARGFIRSSGAVRLSVKSEVHGKGTKEL